MFKMEYLLLFVIGILLLYHLMGSCGYANGVIDGFSVGGAQSCENKLNKLCGPTKGNVFDCAPCAVKNQQQLKAAGCSGDEIAKWCATPTPAPPAPPPSAIDKISTYCDDLIKKCRCRYASDTSGRGLTCEHMVENHRIENHILDIDDSNNYGTCGNYALNYFPNCLEYYKKNCMWFGEEPFCDGACEGRFPFPAGGYAFENPKECAPFGGHKVKCCNYDALRGNMQDIFNN